MARERVDVEITGGFRRVALNVEAENFPLRPSPDGGRRGSKEVMLEPPVVDLFITAKGPPDAVVDAAVTINDKTKSAHFVLRGGGLHHFHAQFPLVDFDL